MDTVKKYSPHLRELPATRYGLKRMRSIMPYLFMMLSINVEQNITGRKKKISLETK